MRRTLLMTAAAVLVSMTGLAHAADTQTAAPAKSWQQGLSRTDLVRQDLGAADREVIQARVDFEPGITSPRHAHPGVEVAYVISGTFEYQLEGRAPVTLKAGDSLFIPEGVAHIAKNVGNEKGSELATYIVKKGEPLLILKQ
ncbi:cupin domain-containing protein [Pseudomonas sp. FW215-R2]|jgi:quercetin dioxygenase-like cupin family protein|uniref:cupin domain-containing protein n=1 Tax=unclassified Pseudomonas TaxID=196821 RepID=UPI000C88E699|nr:MULTISPECIES: cupin domain-containing protein [unclassified Pseudomonas]PMW99519.1 cupin domain-containing protein [Pseudomonas sp. FW215-R2]PMX06072.1 cupin domain-containing protein [Pseudomonas sp. FW215-L1]PMX19456.1 cupin domain-containing protein [Pseudomonas sp. FW215-E1]PNA24762.1 cupin domain-containing protein [Pseudomonas sp. FW215-R4]